MRRYRTAIKEDNFLRVRYIYSGTVQHGYIVRMLRRKVFISEITANSCIMDCVLQKCCPEVTSATKVRDVPVIRIQHCSVLFVIIAYAMSLHFSKDSPGAFKQ